MQAAELRPISLGELLDRTFTLYRNNFLLFVTIMMVPYLFLLALNLGNQALQGVAAGPSGSDRTVVVSGPIGVQGAVVGLTATAVVFIGIVGFAISYGVAQAASVFAVSKVYMGEPATVRGSFAQVKGRMGRAFNVTLTIWIRVILGFMLFIAPGVILACRYAMTMPAAMLEDIKTTPAMRRSIALAENSYGRIILIYILFFVMSYIAMFLFQLPFGIALFIYAVRGETVPWLMTLSSIGEFIGSTVVGPVGAIALTLLYYDERIRKEAFDLQLMLQALDESPASPAAGASLDAFGAGVPRQLS